MNLNRLMKVQTESLWQSSLFISSLTMRLLSLIAAAALTLSTLVAAGASKYEITNKAHIKLFHYSD